MGPANGRCCGWNLRERQPWPRFPGGILKSQWDGQLPFTENLQDDPSLSRLKLRRCPGSAGFPKAHLATPGMVSYKAESGRDRGQGMHGFLGIV